MKSLILIATALVALPARAAAPPATPAHTITYETGPCFGRCPVYRVSVSSDGAGSFEGISFTAVAGTRPFRATYAQYRAFAAQLEPVRPAQGSLRYEGRACRAVATDLPSAEVTWRSRRSTQSLYFYYGCDLQRNRALADRLTAAPALLPIGDFIGRPR
jgi:uncharacterized protein DUF6438